MTSQQVEKKDPELSANQFAEYLTASFRRKEGILRAAKYQFRDNSPPRIRYSQSRKAIARFLSSPTRDFGILYQAKDLLQESLTREEQKVSHRSDFVISDSKLSIDAIDTFIGSLNNISLAGLTFSLGDHRPQRLIIEGVGISVRPDVIIGKVDPRKGSLVGGLLTSYGKEVEQKKEQRKEFCVTAATLVYMYVNDYLADRGEPTRKLCWSMDVFAQEVHEAPQRFSDRVENMKAAGRAIVSQWPDISPPEGWPGT